MISLFPFTLLLFLLDRNNIKRAFTVGKHHCFYITAKFMVQYGKFGMTLFAVKCVPNLFLSDLLTA